MADLTEIKDLVEEQGRAWHEFKRKNDERIAALESKGHAPADLTEQLSRINADLDRIGKDLKAEQDRLDEVEAKSNRPFNGDPQDADKLEHKTAFADYLRKGITGDLRDLEIKAMRRSSDPDGGYLTDYEVDSTITRVAATVSNFRTIAQVRPIGMRGLKRRVKTSGLSGRWIDEQEAGGETTNPKFSQIEIDAHKMEVEPWVTNDMLEDAEYDLEGDLATEAGIGFGETEAAAFISGDGIKKPRGILSYSIVANASYAWGSVGYTASGGAGAFAASNPGDALISLQHSLKQQYRQGAVFLMPDSVLASIRQFKDGSGNFYLWNPDPSGGFGGRILGSPVVIDDNMPVVASNSYSIAFGNFQRGYVIVDRRGTALIRDNVTAKGTTKFNFTRRVGGGIVNFEAIKVMKFASS